MNYDEEKKETKTNTQQEVPTLDGNVGVRATLNNMGIDNSKIGFDEKTGMVTLEGKTLLKPAHYDSDNGITYASESDIRKSVNNFYKDSDDPVVKVTDSFAATAGPYGLSADAISYTDGTVTIGGIPIETMYIDDEGKAWAKQSVVDAAVNRYIDTVDAETPNDVLEQYNNRYLPQIDSLTNRLINREDFVYDPDEDPLYQAYREKYTREAARATENTMANYASLTGGYTNSAAVTAGALAQQYYMKQITDSIPEFAQMAYTRYKDRYEQDAEMADTLFNRYNQLYENAATANTQTIENANKSSESNVKRDAAARDYADKQFEKEWAAIFNEQEARQNDLSYEIDSLTRDEMKRYLENYYDSIMSAEIESGNLDNQINRIRLKQLARDYAMGK